MRFIVQLQIIKACTVYVHFYSHVTEHIDAELFGPKYLKYITSYVCPDVSCLEYGLHSLPAFLPQHYNAHFSLVVRNVCKIILIILIYFAMNLHLRMQSYDNLDTHCTKEQS